MLNCLIVDDERLARDEIRYILSKSKKIDKVYEAESGIDALKYLEFKSVDLVFLDIEMPEISGINVAEILLKRKNSPDVIFITAYKKYAVDAFRVRAIDYILKPINGERILNIVDLYYRNNYIKPIKKNSINNKVCIYSKNKIIPVYYKDILYITVENKETYIYTKDSKFSINHTLTSIMEVLDKKIFFRTHKSYIVNINKIKYIEKWFNYTYNLKLFDTNKVIPVSRSNIKKFKCIMNIF